MNILIDSSVWIDYFRGGEKSEPLDSLLEHNLICTCGFILAEIVPFLVIKNETKLINLLKSIPGIECNIDWERIISYQSICLKNGINGIGIPDLIIADTVIENDVKLFTLDKHFHLIQEHIPINLYIP